MFALVRRHHPIARIAAFAVLFAAIFSGAGVARTLHVLVAHGGGACGTIVCDGRSSATIAPCGGTRASRDGTRASRDGTRASRDGTRASRDGTGTSCDGTGTPCDGTGTPCDGTGTWSACGLDAITRAVRGHAHGGHDHNHDHDRSHHHRSHDCAICLELALLVPALSPVAPFVPFSESVALADEPIRVRWTPPAAPEACAARPPPLRA